MKITRLKVTSYRGIAELDTDVSERGEIVRGRNGSGKTSLIRALRAALAGNDIGPDAIRHGADAAEILVDLDDVSVRRAISNKGSTLTVTREGFKAQKPQAFLTELLGTSPLDPLDLLLLKPKERRARILEALPCAVTREQLLGWAPGLPASFDVDGHGLEVVERARKLFYDRRTEANAKAKESAGAAERARVALGGPVAPVAVPDVASAVAAVEAAFREEHRLAVRADEALAQEKRSVATRSTISTKRDEAERLRANAPAEVDIGPFEAEGARLTEVIASLERQLDLTRKELGSVAQKCREGAAINDARRRALDAAAAGERSAAELEATLANGVRAPTDEERAAATDAVRQAGMALAQARGAEELARQAREAARLADVADADAEAAEHLDGVVRALANDAPKAIAANDAIPGLTLDGDEVLLDGKRLDALCGAEQVRFAVEIARRANAKARFLVVDGLERLDPEQLDAFVAEATRDGFQLIATRVDRGDVVLEHLVGEAADQAAQ